MADRNTEAARLAYHRAGISDKDILITDNCKSALNAMKTGKYVIVDDPMLLLALKSYALDKPVTPNSYTLT